MPIVAKSALIARAAAAAAAVAAAAVPATPVVRPDIQPPARVRVVAVAPTGEPAAATPVESSAAPGPGSERKPDDYVGYKHAPKYGQFQPGVSGNLKGRPKGAKGLKTIVREVMTEKVTVRTAAGPKKMSKMEVQIRKKSEMGINGNLRAMESIEAHYQAAVPDEVMGATVAAAAQPLTPEQFSDIDQAVWDEAVAMIRAGIEDGQ